MPWTPRRAVKPVEAYRAGKQGGMAFSEMRKDADGYGFRIL